MRRALSALALLAAVVSCSSGGTPLAVVASSGNTIGVGEQRVLIALVDPETQAFLASADADATATLRDEGGTLVGTYPLEFVWTVPSVRGLYVARFDIPAAGMYQVTVSQDGYRETAPAGFFASDDPGSVTPGDPAPQTPTRTGDQVDDLSLITTDPVPDPDLYRLSLDEAIRNGRPTVAVFATPAFCTTQACGPMLSQVKDLKFDYPEIDFVHVEIYQDLQVDDPSELQAVEAVVEWRLPSEPWVFAIDADGIVVAAFEGAVNDAELTAVLDPLAGR